VFRCNQQHTEISRETFEHTQSIRTRHNLIISTKILTVTALCRDITTELYEYQENVPALLKKGYITFVIRSFSIRGFVCCHAEQKYFYAARNPRYLPLLKRVQAC
jgi:hypothetical protein